MWDPYISHLAANPTFQQSTFSPPLVGSKQRALVLLPDRKPSSVSSSVVKQV